MINIKSYKIFESTMDNYKILREISSASYIIEDEGYIIIYFVHFLTGMTNRYNKPDIYSYALGDSYDINSKIDSIDDNFKLKSVSLEIVKELPKKTYWDDINKELESKDLFNSFKGKYEILFPNYKITTNSGGPPYLKIEL